MDWAVAQLFLWTPLAGRAAVDALCCSRVRSLRDKRCLRSVGFPSSSTLTNELQYHQPPSPSLSPSPRHGICQMFYTSKIPNFFYFNRKKRINYNIVGKKWRQEYVLLIYCEQIVSFCTHLQTNISYFVKISLTISCIILPGQSWLKSFVYSVMISRTILQYNWCAWEAPTFPMWLLPVKMVSNWKPTKKNIHPRPLKKVNSRERVSKLQQRNKCIQVSQTFNIKSQPTNN